MPGWSPTRTELDFGVASGLPVTREQSSAHSSVRQVVSRFFVHLTPTPILFPGLSVNFLALPSCDQRPKSSLQYGAAFS